MADGMKRVFFVNGPAHPIFTEILEKRSDIRVDKLMNDSHDDVATPVLAGAHAYQAGSARDELAKKYHAGPDLLRRTQSLLIVSTNGAGYDTVNLKACTEAGVLCVNQAGGNKEAVAEHALAMMLGLTKRIIETDRAMRREKDLNRNLFIGHDLRGKTVGIIGLGNVGKRLAELCCGLFSMRVLGYDPYVPAEVMTKLGVEKVELDDLMRQADFVSINCPLTDESRNMVGAKQYALMKPNAYFVTTARGNIHDEKALEEVLRARKIAGAGLDVWEKEPPPLDHPLLQFDNVMVSPHTAGVTREARENMGRIAAEQMLAALDGKPVARVLNPEVWPRYAERFKETFGFAPEGGGTSVGGG
jgi:D-3-phosphoglycerate dehydrogenase / 2-oxoglutarate reductase